MEENVNPKYSWEENWIATWGGEDYESPRRMVVDDDHIYVVGRTWNSETEESDVFLFKCNLKGEIVWNVTWESPNIDWPNEFAICDGFIYVTGVAEVSENDWDVILIKFSKDGQFLWNTSWGGIGWEGEPGRDEGFDVEVLDGYVYVIGTTTSDAELLNEQDILVLKYDSEGRLIWQKNLGESSTYEYGRCLVIENDELIVAGHFLEVEGSERNAEVFLAKLDSDGNRMWNVTAGGGFFSMIVKGMIIDEDCIYVSGEADVPDKIWDIYVAKFDKDGEFQWSDTWGGEGYDASQGGMAVYDERLYVMGETSRYDPKNEDVILLGYDSGGLLLLNSTWGTEANEPGWDISIVGDTMYLMGQTSSKGKTDIYLASLKNPFVVKEEPETKGARGIPGFCYESIVIGLMLAVILMWRLNSASPGGRRGIKHILFNEHGSPNILRSW